VKDPLHTQIKGRSCHNSNVVVQTNDVNNNGGGHMTEGMMVMVCVNGFMFIDMWQGSTIPIISFDYLPRLSAEKNVRP
jgi:hypothetical protein